MLPGDDVELHPLAAELLASHGGHSGQPHEVVRAVHSVRASGDEYLFVLCNCTAEIGFKVGRKAAAPGRERIRPGGFDADPEA